jgi:EF-P beta-lysylation protein EpmB
MIPRLDAPGHTPAWQTALAGGFSSVEALLEHLGIRPQPSLPAMAATFPLRVPRGFVARMEPGNIDDPLLRQVLPVADENTIHPDYACDPLAEQQAMPAPGLLHKYHGRALLTLTGACAVHCRYCFRRHFPYSEANPLGTCRDQAVNYLRTHTEIGELILSGGDPLSLPDTRLSELAGQLAGIEHLHTLRIHTRLPIVLPERVDAALLNWLSQVPQRLVMVLHCNHPNEIDAAVRIAMQDLQRTGVLLLNQSVLLRRINDDADTLARLSEALLQAGILPYYLHQLDRVQGAAHFAVGDGTARALMDALHGRLPGYLVPRLVRELPGQPGKSPLWPLQ